LIRSGIVLGIEATLLIGFVGSGTGIGAAISTGTVVVFATRRFGDGGATETSAVEIGTATGISFIFVEFSGFVDVVASSFIAGVVVVVVVSDLVPFAHMS